MKRREFITLLGGAVAAWPLAARAQDNGRTYRLGFLLPSSRHGVVDAFFDELRLNGFVEGKNLVVMPGGFEATDDNLAERAAALVNAAPDAIVAGPAPPLRALQAITRTIPLIGMSEDMVGEGLVASLARPGASNAIVMGRIAAVRLPSMFQWPETVEAGALAGYGPRFAEMYRQRARMVARILRGANPADTPVEQPARFQLVINLKAAKALGYEVPAGLVLRADEVIE